MRISDWSSDVCSSDLAGARALAHPVQLALQGALARILGLAFLRQALLLLVEPGGVIAFPRNARAAIELEDPAGDIVEEVAIMRSEEHTSELQSLMRISYAVFCLKKKTKI